MEKKKELRSHDDVLEAIAETIDIPEHLHKFANKRYKEIGKYLDRDDSKIKQYNPKISPQGSFLLGTVIRPVSDNDEYDIDLVCTLNATKQDFTMAGLKDAVGFEVIGYAKDRGMKNEPKNKRRCWSMEYADNVCFHMDILPSLPDATLSRLEMDELGKITFTNDPKIQAQAIAITDKTHKKYGKFCDEWPLSNPKGYGVWFRSRQLKAFQERRHAIMKANSVYASVDEVPVHKVKTPLQRAVQLLKRHRDVMFNGAGDAPISIIITTLSAHAYGGERTIGEALRSILKNMDSVLFLENKNGVKWVANPVNPKENFADKWSENPEKEKKFRAWLKKARKDFGLYLNTAPYDKVPSVLQEALSKNTVTKVLSTHTLPKPPIAPTPAIIQAGKEKIKSERRETRPWRK